MVRPGLSETGFLIVGDSLPHGKRTQQSTLAVQAGLNSLKLVGSR